MRLPAFMSSSQLASAAPLGAAAAALAAPAPGDCVACLGWPTSSTCVAAAAACAVGEPARTIVSLAPFPVGAASMMAARPPAGEAAGDGKGPDGKAASDGKGRDGNARSIPAVNAVPEVRPAGLWMINPGRAVEFA